MPASLIKGLFSLPVLTLLNVNIPKGKVGTGSLPLVGQFSGEFNVHLKVLFSFGEIACERVDTADIAHHVRQLFLIVQSAGNLYSVDKCGE